ncbi:MAG: YbhB/YbcL family Raf kinase inhibitor-like protein [Eubacteriales bacterium]|nr:YbhB/YbcL family Raf kinase inhibitor-like protein [Eubacteriales bacterium]
MFKLSSPAIKDGYLDIKYGIDAPDQSNIVNGIPTVSFPFEWSGAPEGTVSYAVEYMDYDNAEDEGVIWIHWVAAGIGADVTELPENGAKDPSIIQGHNSWSLPYGPYEELPEEARIGYGGPAPGRRHTYELVLFALDIVPNLKQGFYYADLRSQMEGHILGRAVLRMYYGK